MRKAISARGIALLKLIEAAGENGLMLTRAEAHMAIKDGDATVDTNVTEGEGDKALAKVTLTDQGRAKLAPKAAIEIDDGVAMPEAKKGGAQRGSKYPFDLLVKVGQSFHVAKTAENPDPVTALASSLTGARRRFAVEVKDENGNPVMEAVTVKTYATDSNGKRVKGEDGKWVVTGETTESRPKLRFLREFVAAEVGANDPKGPGARVFLKAIHAE